MQRRHTNRKKSPSLRHTASLETSMDHLRRTAQPERLCPEWKCSGFVGSAVTHDMFYNNTFKHKEAASIMYYWIHQVDIHLSDGWRAEVPRHYPQPCQMNCHQNLLSCSKCPSIYYLHRLSFEGRGGRWSRSQHWVWSRVHHTLF